MVLDSFVFTIAMPADRDLLSLLREVSGHMAWYLGLPEDEARQAREALHHLVGDRLRELPADAGPIRVSFRRLHTASAVTVEVTSAAVAGDAPAPGAPGIAAARADGHGRILLSWRVHDTE